ncbi:MAG: hypothetical protein Q9187_008084 [Circinaria calcarea]
MSGSPSRRDRRGHGLRNAAAGLGAFGLVRNIMNKRKQRKEDRRIEAIRQQEIEDERLNRSHGKRLTGDGFPRRGGRRGSLTASTQHSADNRPRREAGLPPAAPLGSSGVIPAGIAGAAVGGALADRDRHRSRSQHTILGANNPVLTGNVPGDPAAMPPNPPFAQGALHQDSSGSEVYASTGGRQHRRRSGRGAAAAGLAGGAAGLAAGEALSNHRNQSRDRHHSANEGSVASPPVSVKVKMHSDGRHVTLRRLPEQEAAAERAARRQSRSANGRRHRRGTSASSLSGTDIGGGERWRRTEAIERQQQAEMAQQAQYAPAPPVPYPMPPQPAFHQSGNNLAIPNPLPPPPPIPSSSPLGPPRPGTGSVGSPGTYDGTGTEASADYANNRRRRRAERAQAKQAREGQGVEFS